MPAIRARSNSPKQHDIKIPMEPRRGTESCQKQNSSNACPIFPKGRDLEVIRQITAAIESVEGVSLLDVDPGASTNRTVVTFVGDPEAAVEAAFRGIQKAAELIDMRKQKGAHPRMGATDVCPFIPVSNVSWEEAIACAKKLGQTRRRGAEDSGLSLREGGERSGALESLDHSRGRIRRIFREDQTAGMETGFRAGGVQRKIRRDRHRRARISWSPTT